MNKKQPFDIHIIAMSDSKRRDRFKNFPYPFSFFDAYTKPVDFNLKKAFSLYGRTLRKGEIGCTTSHYELYKRLHNTSAFDWHLILEDDALVETEFQSLYTNFTEAITGRALNDKPLVLILGHSKTSKEFQWVQSLKQPMKTEISIDKHQFGEKYVSLVGTVGYLINDKALKIILQNPPFWLADDWKVLNSLGIHILHIRKNLVYEEFDGISSTDNLIEVQHNIYKTPIKTAIKIILNRLFYFIGHKKRYY